MGRLTEKEAIEGFKIDNTLLGENESATVERNNIAIRCIEELQEYRSICDSPEKLKLIDELYLERCEEINGLKAELAVYKKLEEEELLLRLPCPIGTPVYVVESECEGDPYDCYHCCEHCACYSRFVAEEKFDIELINVLGKLVFLTQEEAEQALERMKEVQDVN